MGFREDYLQKQIRQLAEVVARALGLRQKGKLDEALLATKDAGEELFGLSRDVLDALEPATAARLLQTPAKAAAYAQLLDVEAETVRELGWTELAEALEARAAEMRGS